MHTHLKGEPLTHDDLTDLGLLRLDLIAAVEVRADGQPGKIFVFVDSQLVATRTATRDASPFDVPLPAGRDHVIAVNWQSDYGPVAVGVIKVRPEGRPVTARDGSRR